MSNNETLAKLGDKIKEIARFDELFRELFPANVQDNCMALCPWHDDTTPSLSLKERAGFCHGACSNANTPKAYDVFDAWQKQHGCNFPQAVNDLAARYGLEAVRRKQVSGPNIIKTYDYTDEAGRVLFQVCRLKPKSFRQRQPNDAGGWTWHVKGVQIVLYRLTQIIVSDTVCICEGEKDADTLHDLGLCGTTSPMGAGKWPNLVENYHIHEPLKDKTVFILPDNDKQGKDHAQDIAKTLHGFAASVKILSLPGLPERGDVSDFIAERGAEAKSKLLEIAERTPEYKPPRGGPEIISLQDLMAMKIAEPQWVVHGLIPEGLGLLVAKPKSGKSFLNAIISLAVARGVAALGHFLTNQAATLGLCLEDTPRRMKKRYSLMLGDNPPPKNHFIVCEWPPFDRGGVDLLHKTLENNPEIKFVSIDTWGRFRPRRGRVDDVYSSDYADLQQLHSLAGMFQVAILLIHHLRKETSDDAIDGILGSTALSGAADSILILKRKSRTDSDAVLSVTGRDIPDQEHALSFDAGVWSYKGNPLELQLTAKRREIRETLSRERKPLSATEVAQFLGKGVAAVHKLMASMVERGQLERATGQKGKFVLPPEDEFYHVTESYQGEIYLDRI